MHCREAGRAPKRVASKRAGKQSSAAQDIVDQASTHQGRAPAGSARATKTPDAVTGNEARPRRTTPGKQPATRQKSQDPERDAGASAALLCPKCKAGVLRLSRDEKFYGCGRYNEGCSLTINTTIAGRKMKPADIAALCSEGRTPKLTGFISKTGRPFEATLVLSEAGRIEFSFAPR